MLKKLQCLWVAGSYQRGTQGALWGFPLFSCSAALKASVRLIGLYEQIWAYLHTKDTFPSGHLSCACSSSACLVHQQPSHSAACPVASASVRNESPPLVPSSPRSGSQRPFWKHDLWRFSSPDLNEVKVFHWEIKHRDASQFLCSIQKFLSTNFIWDHLWRALGSACEVRVWTCIRITLMLRNESLVPPKCSWRKLLTCSLTTLLVSHWSAHTSVFLSCVDFDII